MQLNPYLHFNGQCEEAFKFYEKCLGGKITFMMPHEGTPVADQVPQEWGKKILHATLNIGEDVLQGADSPPNHYQKPQGFSVSISTNDPAEADRMGRAAQAYIREHYVGDVHLLRYADLFSSLIAEG